MCKSDWTIFNSLIIYSSSVAVEMIPANKLPQANMSYNEPNQQDKSRSFNEPNQQDKLKLEPYQSVESNGTDITRAVGMTDYQEE